MKVCRTFFLITLCLIFLSLACNIPDINNSDEEELTQPVQISSITINPQSGPGDFFAVVKGPVHEKADTLRCYISGDESNLDVHNRTIPRSPKGEFLEDMFDFTYTAPGQHSVICQAEISKSTASASFTVTAPEEPAPENSDAEPSGEVLQIDPSKLYHGDLRFVVSEAEASEAGYHPVEACWPAVYYDDGGGYLRLTADGKIEGHCAWTSPSSANPQVTWNNLGTLTGSYSASTGLLTFHLDTHAEYPNINTTITLTFNGTGSFTSSTHAEGLANFTAACRSTGGGKYCALSVDTDVQASWDVTGDVPWTMDFTP